MHDRDLLTKIGGNLGLPKVATGKAGLLNSIPGPTLEASFRSGSPSLLTSAASSLASPSGLADSSSYLRGQSTRPEAARAEMLARMAAARRAWQPCCQAERQLKFSFK